jgi:ribose 5-phosphate isomerase B
MRLAVGSDHAGFPMKAFVLEQLETLGHQVTDVGSYDPEPVDFPDIARKACGLVNAGEADRAILVCGSGVGATIAANKVAGIRAALIHDTHCAHQAVEHDDVNVMCIGAKIVGPWLVADLLRAFLDARFEATEQFRRRVAKLAEMDAARGAG